MQNLSVIVNGISNNERFLNKLFTNTGDKFDIEFKDNTLFFNNIEDDDKNILIECLAKTIIFECEKNILVKVINKNCECFDKRDKIEIWKISMRQLLDDEHSNNDDYTYRLGIVKNNLLEFFESSNELSLEGFINFRLNEYFRELEDVVDASVREYMIEVEYMEFISMLKYYISMQPPKYHTVTISYDNDITIFADGTDVTSECVEDFHEYVGFDDENKDDFVLNSLISIAPRKIEFYIGDLSLSNELKDTLNGVFGERVKFYMQNKFNGIH